MKNSSSRRSRPLRRCLLALLFVAPTWAATPVPVQKEFQNWVVTCDNLRSCIAEGADQDNPSLVLRFIRDAGPHDSVSLEIYGSDGDSKHLRVDGKPLSVAAEDWESQGNDEESPLLTSSQGEVHKLVDAMRNGHKLSSADASVSLDGLSAALLLIDDVQGRIDTDTAWVRRGYKLPDAVPPAPSMPVIVAAPFHGPALMPAQNDAVVKAALAKARQADNADCDLEGVGDEPHTEATRLNTQEALVLVECARGAYQSGYLVFRVPVSQPSRAQQISLPWLPGEPAQDVIYEAEFDADKGRLSQRMKGRGIGDCGESSEWAFDGRGFVLTAVASEPRCPGILLDFPDMWRSR